MPRKVLTPQQRIQAAELGKRIFVNTIIGTRSNSELRDIYAVIYRMETFNSEATRGISAQSLYEQISRQVGFRCNIKGKPMTYHQARAIYEGINANPLLKQRVGQELALFNLAIAEFKPSPTEDDVFLQELEDERSELKEKAYQDFADLHPEMDPSLFPYINTNVNLIDGFTLNGKPVRSGGLEIRTIKVQPPSLSPKQAEFLEAFRTYQQS